MEEETEAEAKRLAERDASNMLLFTVKNNLKKVFNSLHYIIRREKMSSGDNNISALVQNNLIAVFYKNNEGEREGQGEGQEDSRENNISALVQNNLFAVFYKNNEGGGEREGQEEGDSRENNISALVQNNLFAVFLVLHKDIGEREGEEEGEGEEEEEGREREEGERKERERKQKAISYNFVKEEIPGNDSKEYTILSKKDAEPSYNINELLNAYNYVIHIKGNLIIKYNIQRYYNIKHILKIIYDKSGHIIIISKKTDFDNEGLYQ